MCLQAPEEKSAPPTLKDPTATLDLLGSQLDKDRGILYIDCGVAKPCSLDNDTLFPRTPPRLAGCLHCLGCAISPVLLSPHQTADSHGEMDHLQSGWPPTFFSFSSLTR